MKEGELKQKPKEFLFVVYSRKEGEDWVGTIEYLRTKASVELFISKFGNVRLQLGTDFQPVLSQPISSKLSSSLTLCSRYERDQ